MCFRIYMSKKQIPKIYQQFSSFNFPLYLPPNFESTYKFYRIVLKKNSRFFVLNHQTSPMSYSILAKAAWKSTKHIWQYGFQLCTAGQGWGWEGGGNTSWKPCCTRCCTSLLFANLASDLLVNIASGIVCQTLVLYTQIGRIQQTQNTVTTSLC